MTVASKYTSMSKSNISLQYVLPWLVNQAGSLSYLAAVQRAPLSVAVPVANSLAFVFTAITGASVGAEEPLDASMWGFLLVVQALMKSWMQVCEALV